MSNKPPQKAPPPEPKVYFVQKTVSGETFTVLAASRLELEDEFSGLYFTATQTERVVIQPPFEPKQLAALGMQNNTLEQCIAAMEVNIDGTGYEFIPAVEPDPDDESDEVEGVDADGQRLPGQPIERAGEAENAPFAKAPEDQRGNFAAPQEEEKDPRKASPFDLVNKAFDFAKRKLTPEEEAKAKEKLQTEPGTPPLDVRPNNENPGVAGAMTAPKPLDPKEADPRFAATTDTVEANPEVRPEDGSLPSGNAAVRNVQQDGEFTGREQTPDMNTSGQQEDPNAEGAPPPKVEFDPLTGEPLPPKKLGDPWAGKMDPEEKRRLKAFFDEPYPGVSFIKIRRELRRQMEAVGYGFLEVLRNAAGEVVGLRNVNTWNTRMVKLDAPALVTKKLVRDGKEVELQMWERERRFMQSIPGHPNEWAYFREYGSTRHVHRTKGHWESKEHPIEVTERGGELMVFGVVPDTSSPYFLPRWLNQLPSVVGSRKAEEQNLEFLDAGGLPPAMVFVQGGTVGQTSADELRGYLSGKAKTRNRAVVVEVMPNSGSFDGTSQIPQVKVERFGSEKVNDSLYAGYDKTCGEHIRMGFRLPPLFLGLPENYNFATAYTAYMIAEAQVFQPERQRFDEVINATLMKELGAKTCKFRSLPLTLKNVEVQIQALGLVSGQVEGAGLVDEVNKLAGLSLEYKEPPAPPMGFPGMPGMEGPPQLDEEGNPIQPEEGAPPEEEAGKVPPQFQKKDPNSLSGGKPQPGGNMPAVQKKPLGLAGGMQMNLKSDGMELVRLAKAYLRAEGLLAAKFEMSEETKDRVYKQVAELDEAQAAQFYEMVATMTLGNPGGANLVRKHEHTDSCTQVHNPAPQVDVAAVVAPIVDLIAKQDERMAAQNEVLVDMLEKTSENTGRLAEAVIAQSERPIEVTVVNEAKKSSDKEFQFSDGRVVKLREVKGA